MKKQYLIIILLVLCRPLHAQITNSAISITKTWSPNRRFYIQATPYTNEEPSLKGKAEVYNHKGKLLYKFDRGFNGLREYGNHLAISNDGNTVAYIVAAYPDDKTAGLKTISIYRKGVLIKDFTLAQFTGCDPENERCSLLYSNYEMVVNFKKSHFGTKSYHKVFKDSVSDEEKFLNSRAIDQRDNLVYIVDSKKKTHIIDLEKADTIPGKPFASIYPILKDRPADTLTTYQQFDAPYPKTKSWFPNLANGDATAEVLGKLIGYKPAYVQSQDFFKYHIYRVNIEAYISRDGTIDIQKLTADKKLRLDTISRFFREHKYDVNFLPPGIDKWYFSSFFCGYRNISDSVALAEKQQEQKDMLAERQRRMTLDSINGVYIPRNLEECFTGLDKVLSNAQKKEMKALKNRSGMMNYYMNLGMWIRNNWGLWGGSRLLQYFTDRTTGFGARRPDPEGLSMVILNGYYDWLQGDKNIGTEWEEKNPVLVKK
jgi:hypothetical protein